MATIRARRKRLSTQRDAVAAYLNDLADKIADGSAIGTIRVKIRRSHEVWMLVAHINRSPSMQSMDYVPKIKKELP